jgi:hypothetical protein
MRNISLSLAALTLVLAGSLTSVAFADTERQHALQRADRENGGESTTTLQSQTKSDLVVSDASGIYDSSDNFRDATGHPLSGWGYLVYGSVSG